MDKGRLEIDPRGLIYESYRIEGIRIEECRSIFLDWAMGLPPGADMRAALAGMPWVGTMSFDTAGRTMMGVTSTDFAALAAGIENRPEAFGANCGVGSSDLLRTILGFAAAGTGVPIVAKGNAGIPKYVDGEIVYDGTPALMADYAQLARDAGAKIIGGCCGTTPEHLRAMREALETRPKASEAPSLELIEAKLGPYSSETDGTIVCGHGHAHAAPRQRERTGRRRRPE